MTDAELDEMGRRADQLDKWSQDQGYRETLETACADHIHALVAEVRRLRALLPAPAGSVALLEQLCELRGARFGRGTPPGAAAG